MVTESWFSRIPAAIAKAEAWLDSPPPTRVLLGSGPYGEHDTRAAEDKQLIGRFEDENEARVSTLGPDAVALAKALWNWEENYGYIRDDIIVPEERGLPDPALRAFCEKVEAL